MLSVTLLSMLACDTGCPAGQTCQAPAAPTPAAVDLAGVDAFMQKDFWGTTDGGIGPDLGAGATEVHDGIYGVVARPSNAPYSAIGFVMARDGVANVPNVVPPPADNEETWCASRGFSWPQFLGAGPNPATVSWAVMPMSDNEPAQAKCNGAPIRLQGTFDPVTGAEYPLDTSPTKAGVKRFLVESCATTGTGALCPAAAVGTPDTSGTRATSLRPGVYTLQSTGILEPTAGPDTYISGTATLFIRPAADATKPWGVETYCFDDNFRWPRVRTGLIPGAQPGVAFWSSEFTVTPKVDGAGMPEAAPAVVATCPASQPQRADYCFSADSAQPCPH